MKSLVSLLILVAPTYMTLAAKMVALRPDMACDFALHGVVGRARIYA